MKGGREHRVPLSDRAIALLRALPREADFVFAGERRGTAIASTAMSNLLGRMGPLAVTVHGFRSAFRDWAAETTGYPNHVFEMALAHAIGAGVLLLVSFPPRAAQLEVRIAHGLLSLRNKT
jgi:integrase